MFGVQQAALPVQHHPRKTRKHEDLLRHLAPRLEVQGASDRKHHNPDAADGWTVQEEARAPKPAPG